ncbi:LuxR family transcriptional regulator [Streptomyces sp. TX20-6-3]|uniref:helix-turn-helix transcriptional regulator n=1 Tax=Streptomyces sp. TX20-6-3 TaxID=3028705 RepID=UPI0029A65CDB|nr:LuxR family transcriptional regulator [Streptomyces sp. TX20-6-3]MDX2565282.1 LuxR family transcriptional regulator [Streptomyces sp. TX20-6-3]
MPVISDWNPADDHPARVELIGRNQELTRSLKVLSSPSALHSGVLIVGTAGIGKTRLIEEIVGCLRASGTPSRFMFIRPSFLCSIQKNAESSVTSAPQIFSLEEPAGPNQIRRLLASPPARRPILVIDDSQSLDEETAEILLEIARRRTAILLLSADMQHANSGPLISLWKDELVRRIDLLPLPLEETNYLARLWMDGQSSSHRAQKLSLLSGGNPLILRELIKAAASTESSERGSGDASMDSSGFHVSPSLEEFTSHLLGSLSSRQRKAIDLVSLAGEIPLRILEQMTDSSSLLELEKRSLISLCNPRGDALPTGGESVSRIAISNPLISLSVLHAQKPLARRSLTKELIFKYPLSADLLTDNDRLRLIWWRAEVEPEALSERDLLLATELAQRCGNLTAAVQFARSAWRKFRSVKAAISFARLCVTLGNDGMARSLAKEHGAEAAKLYAIATRGLILQGRHDEAQEFLGELSDADHRICTGMHLHLNGDFKESIEILSPLLEHGNPSYKAEAAIFITYALCSTGRPEAALGLSEQILQEDFDITHDPSHLILAEFLEDMRCVALLNLGRLKEALTMLEIRYKEALAGNDPQADARRGVFLGSVLLEIGLPQSAMEYLRLSGAYSTGWEFLEQKGYALETLACSLFPDTRHEEMNFGIRDNAEPLGYLAGLFALITGWCEVKNSNFAHASERLVQQARLELRKGAFGEVVKIVHNMARLGFAHLTSEFWDVPVEGAYLECKLTFSKAVACENVNLLRRSAAAFASSGAFLYAAEAYAELSRLYQKQGNDRASTAARQQAAAFSGRCEGAVTPALRMLTEVSHLSAREREIAGLVARGLSDKEIAESLVLSPRTVGNHLYRIYRKIGVADRRELRSRWGKVQI